MFCANLFLLFCLRTVPGPHGQCRLKCGDIRWEICGTRSQCKGSQQTLCCGTSPVADGKWREETAGTFDNWFPLKMRVSTGVVHWGDAEQNLGSCCVAQFRQSTRDAHCTDASSVNPQEANGM